MPWKCAAASGSKPWGEARTDGSLAFEGDFGGVSYGALTGIDAAGQQVPGELHRVPGGLELILPDSFVQSAQWPILFDPLIGSLFKVTFPIQQQFGSEQDSAPRLAYDGTTDTFLVVFSRSVSGSSAGSTLFAQRFKTTALPTASTPTLQLVTGSSFGKFRVANVNHSNRFAVAWIEDQIAFPNWIGRVWIQLVPADPTLPNSAKALVAFGDYGKFTSLDLSGDVATGLLVAPRVLVAWTEAVGGVQGAFVNVPVGNVDPTVHSQVTLAADPGTFDVLEEVALSSTNSGGRRGVVWIRRNSLAGTTRVYGTTVDSTGTPLHTPALLSGSSTQCSVPVVDGGFETVHRYVAAFQEGPLASPANTWNLRTVAFSSSTSLNVSATVPQVAFASSPAEASLGWRPGKVYLAYTRDFSVYLRGLSSLDASAYEGQILVAAGAPTAPAEIKHTQPFVCMRASGGDLDKATGVVVWRHSFLQTIAPFLTAAQSQIDGQRIDAFSSAATVSGQGGQCGSVGLNVADQPPAIGNGTFRLELQGGSPASLLAFLNIAPPQPTVDCGTCRWLPFQTTFSVPTVNGNASLSLPIPPNPALAGLVADTQWTVYKPGASACPGLDDLGLSNILRLTFN